MVRCIRRTTNRRPSTGSLYGKQKLKSKSSLKNVIRVKGKRPLLSYTKLKKKVASKVSWKTKLNKINRGLQTLEKDRRRIEKIVLKYKKNKSVVNDLLSQMRGDFSNGCKMITGIKKDCYWMEEDRAQNFVRTKKFMNKKGRIDKQLTSFKGYSSRLNRLNLQGKNIYLELQRELDKFFNKHNKIYQEFKTLTRSFGNFSGSLPEVFNTQRRIYELEMSWARFRLSL